MAPDTLTEFAELMRDAPESSDDGGVARAARRARRRRGLLIAALVVAVVLAAVGGYVGWALTAPLPAPAIASQTPRVTTPEAAGIALPKNGATAISIAGGDDYLGATASDVWMASGTDEPRPIASLSKLVTALVVLDARPLASADDPGPTITFGKAAHDLYDEYYVLGATIAPMPTGTTMSQRDALATMLVPSASNYADAVSTWAFGSRWAFLEATRTWLAAQGLTGTTIVEPTGIDPHNTSTPSDLLKIAKIAAANPGIAKIAAMPALTLPGPGVMYNTNGLLGTSGITGLKTGNLGANTYNLLYTATLDVGAGGRLDVTGVVLGGESRDSVDRSVLAQLDGIRAGFHEVPVAKGGQEVGSYTTPWGSTATMVVDRHTSIFTWSDTPIAVTMDTSTPTDYVDGEVIGSITWTAGPKTVSTDIRIDGSIEPPTAWWRLTHPAELGG